MVTPTQTVWSTVTAGTTYFLSTEALTLSTTLTQTLTSVASVVTTNIEATSTAVTWLGFFAWPQWVIAAVLLTLGSAGILLYVRRPVFRKLGWSRHIPVSRLLGRGREKKEEPAREPVKESKKERPSETKAVLDQLDELIREEKDEKS